MHQSFKMATKTTKAVITKTFCYCLLRKRFTARNKQYNRYGSGTTVISCQDIKHANVITSYNEITIR